MVFCFYFFVDSGYSKEWKFAEKLFVGRAMLHMADISNPLRQFTVARLWANRILTEFFEQVTF